MRYLQLSHMSTASTLLNQLESDNPNLSFILEPYSCKSTKKQKKKNVTNNFHTQNLINTLDLSFIDYTFNIQHSTKAFQKTETNECKKLITNFFTFMQIMRACDVVDSLFSVIDKTVDIKNVEIYSYDKRQGPFEESVWFFCFLFYNKKSRRIVLFSGMLNNKV